MCLLAASILRCYESVCGNLPNKARGTRAHTLRSFIIFSTHITAATATIITTMPEISKCEHQTNFFFVHNKNLLFLSISFFYLNEFLFCFLLRSLLFFPSPHVLHLSRICLSFIHFLSFFFSSLFLSSFVVQAMMSTGNVKVRVMPLLFDINVNVWVWVCMSIQKKQKKRTKKKKEIYDVVEESEKSPFFRFVRFALCVPIYTETNEIHFFSSSQASFFLFHLHQLQHDLISS